MSKLKLNDWAAISEITGTVAVVISLVLVVHSINRNTEAMQIANENLLYEMTDSSLESLISEPELSESFAKIWAGDELSQIDMFRLDVYTMRYMNRWNYAFDRYRDGVFEEEKWQMWNTNYASGDKAYLRKWWAENKVGYGTEFSDHIESVISSN